VPHSSYFVPLMASRPFSKPAAGRRRTLKRGVFRNQTRWGREKRSLGLSTRALPYRNRGKRKERKAGLLSSPGRKPDKGLKGPKPLNLGDLAFPLFLRGVKHRVSPLNRGIEPAPLVTICHDPGWPQALALCCWTISRALVPSPPTPLQRGLPAHEHLCQHRRRQYWGGHDAQASA
jgi:hypothetical protein